MDQALRRDELTSSAETRRIFRLLAELDATQENADLYGDHSPFAAYTMQPDARNAHLLKLTNSRFSAAALPSFGNLARSYTSQNSIITNFYHVGKFSQTNTQPRQQQEALEKAFHVQYDWATIYLDITPLALGEPETKRQRELAEFIRSQIPQ